MAKRRKLEAPSAAELSAMEAEIAMTRAEKGRAAPIAQVAAEASAFAPVSDPRDIADARAMREARGQGRVIEQIPLEQIDPLALVRDRLVLDVAEMEELKRSIQRGGLRLPIEVFVLQAPEGEKRYGLISGYRRFLAMSQLHEMFQDATFATIKALVIGATDGSDAMVRMVEENEVRAALSPFERGRIAVLAAEQGVYANTHAAVDGLFPVASKAKRSKIRSFAMVFEELGDLIVNGDQMLEKQGLRLAAALRDGGEPKLRAALEQGRDAKTFGEEWALLEPVVTAIEAQEGPAKPSRGGRPKRAKVGWDGDTLHLASGFKLTRYSDGADQLIRISGRLADQEIGEAAMMAVKGILDRG